MNRLLLYFFCSLLFCCSSQDHPNPKADIYIYADVDGKPFRYEGEDNYIAENYHAGSLPRFYFVGEISEYEGLGLTVPPLSGKPETVNVLGALYRNSRFDTYATGYHGELDRPVTGKCTITRVNNEVVEGTFYVDVYSEYGKGNKVLKVTNGRFRVRYN